MMASPSHLKSLQALELAARTGSFALAAERLAITPAAVGQRVKALEDYLGVTLLERGRAGIRPTPALEAALPDLAAGFAALEAASEALDMARARELHIAADPDFADLWLLPRLGAFRAAHPNIRINVNGAGDAPVRQGRVDCEIACGAVEEGASLLFRDVLLPLVSPVNARRIGRSDPATALEGFPLLHGDFYRNDPAAPSWPLWFAANHIPHSAPGRGMRFARIVDLVAAIEADAGIGLCGVALLAEAIEAGRIGPLYPGAKGCATRHCYIARYRRQGSARRVLEPFEPWLANAAERTRAWLARKSAALLPSTPGLPSV
jgi:LysR family glycine cleavage system transcriptional activator